MRNEMDFIKGFTIDFHLKTGLSQLGNSTKRYLSDMRGMFSDSVAYEKILSKNNPLIYEFYELGAPEDSGDLAFGTSIVYPGKVGNEYHMTKGHFHNVLDTAEVYLCLSGKGLMMMENSTGDWSVKELSPGMAVYVPKGYAHRSINIGTEPFVTFFAFRGDAGHDYGTIEEKGFRNIVVEKDGNYDVVANPKWV